MVQSNHSALSQGLKLYTDAMRRFIKHRLIAGYPNDWWRQGVLNSLQETQRRNLEREANRDPNRDKADFLDPAHFVAIVTRQFDRVFAEAFHDFKKTQAWLLGTDVASSERRGPPHLRRFGVRRRCNVPLRYDQPTAPNRASRS